MGRKFYASTSNPLRAVRLAAGMSQEEVALRAGISQQQVARLERGQRRGRPDTWRRIAAALGVPVDLLMPAPGRRRPRRRARGGHPPAGGVLR